MRSPSSPKPTSPLPGDTEPTEMSGNVFYHGTSKRNARKILREGFRDCSWTAETPLLKYKAKEGIARWMHGGCYGRGTYVTCNWRSALFFGPVLFRVGLRPGTRILPLDQPPDGKVLDSLKRNYGKEILTKSPWKVMPANKRLTLDEAIQLSRHHAAIWEGGAWRNPRAQIHEKLMFDLRNVLVRYGIQGWGDPNDLCGIVIFATDRINLREVVLSLPTDGLLESCKAPGLQAPRFASLESMSQICRSARNRGAANTLRWVAEANEELEERFD